jgi:hypothetical protein
MEKVLVAQRVATRLFSTENAVDTAIFEASQLMGALIEARREMDVAATLGTDAVSKIAVAMSALSAAREACVAAHHELAEVKLRVGVRTKMIGTGPKGFAAPSAAESDLRMVG